VRICRASFRIRDWLLWTWKVDSRSVVNAIVAFALPEVYLGLNYSEVPVWKMVMGDLITMKKPQTRHPQGLGAMSGSGLV